MSLQDLFYLLGIIYMSISLLFFIVVIITLLYIKKKISAIYYDFSEKFELVKAIVKHPQTTAKAIGSAVADIALTKASDFLEKNKNKAKS